MLTVNVDIQLIGNDLHFHDYVVLVYRFLYMFIITFLQINIILHSCRKEMEGENEFAVFY